jgi:hypothetical protein
MGMGNLLTFQVWERDLVLRGEKISISESQSGNVTVLRLMRGYERFARKPILIVRSTGEC